MVTKVDSGVIAHDGGTIKDALDKAKPIADYAALRTYTGNATQVRITNNGLSGFFYYDASDTTSLDNGGTIIVASNGKRWKRVFDGAVNVKWFGALGDGSTDDTNAVQRCWDFCRLKNKTAWVPEGIYRISQTNISYGMSISGEAGATFKLLDNQGKFARMLTTQNNTWAATSPTEDSPVLFIRGITFDGNRANQGPYINYEKEQQSMLFLHGGVGGVFGAPKLRVILESCIFKESCGDGVAIYHDVDVSASNCFFWNCFRGSFVIIGGNNITRCTNIKAGGDVHNSFFQAEQEGSIGGTLTLSNSVFDALHGNDQAGTGGDFGFQAGSKVTVSNCVFNAGIVAAGGFNSTSTLKFDNCIFRQLTGNDNLVRYGNMKFTNCKFINTVANTTGRMLNYRDYNVANLSLAFEGCDFDSEFNPLDYLTPLTITSVTEITNAVFEFTTFAAHNFPTPTNYSYDSVIISGLTESSYNKAYRIETTPTAFTFRVSITEYVGTPLLGATPLAYLSTRRYMPDAILGTIAQITSNRLTVKNCRFSSNLNYALSVSSGTLEDFSGNIIRSNIALGLSATNNQLIANIGSNTFDCGWFLSSQGGLIDGSNRINFYGTEVPAKCGYVRFSSGVQWISSEICGKVKLVSNRARPNTAHQKYFWTEYQYTNAPIGTPRLYGSDGAQWYACCSAVLKNTSANRPVLSSIDGGQQYFDTTLDPDGKPIWWTGVAWVDSTGLVV